MSVYQSSHGHGRLPTMSEKERLMMFGYKSEQIIEYADGSAVLDYEAIRLDSLNQTIWKSLKKTS